MVCAPAQTGDASQRLKNEVASLAAWGGRPADKKARLPHKHRLVQHENGGKTIARILHAFAHHEIIRAKKANFRDLGKTWPPFSFPDLP